MQWDREELALSGGVRLVLREASSCSILNHGCACACMSSLPWESRYQVRGGHGTGLIPVKDERKGGRVGRENLQPMK